MNNQIQTAMERYEKALQIAKEGGDKEQETRAYLDLGDAYIIFKNQTQTARECYEKALKIAIEREYKKQETRAYLEEMHTY